MLQTHLIKEHKADYIKALKKRNFDAEDIFENVLALDQARRSTQTELDDTLAESNKLSKEIGILFKKGETESANQIKEKTKALKETSKSLSDRLTRVSEELESLLYTIPNIPHKTVHKGKSDEDNEEVFREGNVPELGNNALPHWELAKKYDIIDFELGNKITGAGFPVYKGKGARLQRALVTYFLDKNTAAGYTEYQLPLMVNETSGLGTGQLPDKEGQMYEITKDDLYLIPTSEVPLVNIFRGNLLNEKDLPISCTAYTPCFRREAGSYGSHVRGLNRLHQFDKVELVTMAKAEDSYQKLFEMVEHVKIILRELQLPYRILRLCGGDLGFTAALTFDFEVYSTAQNRWLEISSISNLETFQSNRMKMRYKGKDGQKHLIHTLNGSSLALPRVLAGIMENYQTADGIEIPDVLQPYTGFSKIEN